MCIRLGTGRTDRQTDRWKLVKQKQYSALHAWSTDARKKCVFKTWCQGDVLCSFSRNFWHIQLYIIHVQIISATPYNNDSWFLATGEKGGSEKLHCTNLLINE